MVGDIIADSRVTSPGIRIVVDSTPQVHSLAGDPNNHLVTVPPIDGVRTAPP
jgi:hypothetical protein